MPTRYTLKELRAQLKALRTARRQFRSILRTLKASDCTSRDSKHAFTLAHEDVFPPRRREGK